MNRRDHGESSIWSVRARRSELQSLFLRVPGFQHAYAFVDVRQSNRQSKAFAFAAFDGEFAAVLAHNAAHYQQAKAGPRWFRREIRLKDAAQIFGRHAAAGIDETDENLRVVHVRVNAQDASAFHGFEAVFDHVVKSLFHLTAIDLE